MIKVENIEVFNFDGAIRGMRNPLQSHSKSDSFKCDGVNCRFDECPYYERFLKSEICGEYDNYIVGKNDLDLMRRLYKAGSEHRKYLRQIFVCMDITTNHTVWAELDTYKVGTVRNSESKMHRIHVKEFTLDDFSCEGIVEVGGDSLEHHKKTIAMLEVLRNLYNSTHEKKYWRAIIDMLPMGYNLKATFTINYENVINIIKQRSGHKMQEWNDFVSILKDLPYIKEIMGETE